VSSFFTGFNSDRFHCDLLTTADMSETSIHELKAEAAGHLACNDLPAAIRLYEQACNRQPADAGTWLILANLYRQTGNTGKAMNAAHQASNAQPGNAATLRFLAELQLNAGQPQPCINTCRRLLQLSDTDAAACSLMGTALQIQGNLFESRHAHERAVCLEPGNATFCYKYACVLQALGELEKALVFFNKAREKSPEFTAALGGLVRIHAQLDNADELDRLIDPLMQAGRRDPLLIPTIASIAPRFNRRQQAIDLAETHLRNTSLPPDVQARLHWALGTLYESANDHDLAFHHHTLAKPGSTGSYDARVHSGFVDRIMAQYTREFLGRAETSTVDTTRPVFIVGMPRSGTSLVEQILASHSAVHGAGELPHLSWIANALARLTASGKGYPEAAAELTRRQCDEYASRYVSMLAEIAPGTALRITDKMPHNFRFLGLVQQLFPQSRIIHVQRDPLDTCLSCYFQEFSAAHAYTRTLRDLGTHYLDYQRLMQHWSEVLTIPLITVRYEDLVADPGTESRRLLEFCALEWEEQCLEFYTSRRKVPTLSAEQVKKPIYTSSVGRWRNHEAHLGELIGILNTGIADAPGTSSD